MVMMVIVVVLVLLILIAKKIVVEVVGSARARFPGTPRNHCSHGNSKTPPPWSPGVLARQ